MKLSIRALAAGAVLIGCASALAGVVAARASSTTANETALVTLPRATPAGQVTLYGHVKSLVRKNGRWEMKFDPALLLRGTAAEHIALEDTGSSDVPNDSLTLEEGHRLLTFTVALESTGDRPDEGPRLRDDLGRRVQPDPPGQEPEPPTALR